MTMARARVLVGSFLAVAAAAGAMPACGGGGGGDLPKVGSQIEQQQILIGMKDEDITFEMGTAPVRLLIPMTALAVQKTVVVRQVASLGVRKGAVVPTDSAVQIATRDVTFTSGSPARMQHAVPPAGPKKHYVAVHLEEDEDTWTAGAPAKTVAPLPGKRHDAAAAALVGEEPLAEETLEIEILGSGVWAIGLVDDSPTKPDAGSGDAGAPDGGSFQGPIVAGLSIPGGTAGQAVDLTILGSGFGAGAQAYFDGKPVTSTVGASGLTVHVAADATLVPGQLAVFVENEPGNVASRSNTLYYVVAPVPGAPQIFDYTPDNGLPGDKIRIISTNLSNGGVLSITDAKGLSVAAGTLGTISWPTVGVVETVEITLPANFATGPITVKNDKGLYRGKIFNVGQNLSRLPGTLLSARTQYNTSNWSIASGGDNQLSTSYFSAIGDCATQAGCTTVPFYQVTFSSPQPVGRIALRGNREYMSGYDFIRVRFEVVGAGDAIIWSSAFDLPQPDRDVDVFLSKTLTGVTAVRFVSEADESSEPGFAEFEVFPPVGVVVTVPDAGTVD